MGYSDHPDGKECFEKIWACTKYSGLLGLVVSTYDVLMFTKPQGYVPTLGAYVRSTVPLAGAGAAFAAVTCASTALRGKDDKYNYLLGGGSAGGIIGVAARSFRVGVPVAFFLGAAAVIYKDSKENGWELFPKITHRVGSFDHVNYDFTLQKPYK
ncbi:NADH dehydrogenase [ubiquinone] 1 alpha subcomplex subunit 11-like [Penaeus japonicus]|uniref:NADH dehydrogenase [ubiquinone] 1 alpha subcomplex subunit 11-like n=1 Tax=Penaeus japonicus TaxID=27405 RepID=UPI001C70E01F|nr:NADH dehydrogenase [ubiquinone] 1 alpha subcomplex subunit 11-like [Penaeus japonicus]